MVNRQLMFTTNFQLLLINTNTYKSIYENLNLIKKECYKKYSDTKRENVEMKVKKLSIYAGLVCFCLLKTIRIVFYKTTFAA
jgi:hypothetical protein